MLSGCAPGLADLVPGLTDAPRIPELSPTGDMYFCADFIHKALSTVINTVAAIESQTCV